MEKCFLGCNVPTGILLTVDVKVTVLFNTTGSLKSSVLHPESNIKNTQYLINPPLIDLSSQKTHQYTQC